MFPDDKKNFRESYRINISNLFRGNEPAKSKINPAQVNTIEVKPRLRKQQAPPPPHPAVIKSTNASFTDPFWANDSSLNFNDDKKLNSNSLILRVNKIKIQDVSLPNKNDLDSNNLNTPISNSIIKWSKQLGSNQVTPRLTSISNVNLDESIEIAKSTADKASKSLIDLPLKKDVKKLKIEKKVPALNRLMDIIERENTSFSIKLAYDNPFQNRQDALSPHTYLDLDIDPQLKLARENTLKNMQENFEPTFGDELERTRKFRKTNTISPEIYQSLTKPSQINLYSELNIQEDSLKWNKTKPRGANYIQVKSKNMVKNNSTKIDQKFATGYNSLELESSQIFDRDEDMLMNSMDKMETKNNDIYSQNQLVQSSHSMFDQGESKFKEKKEDKNYQKNLDLSILDGMIMSMKQKDLLKESPLPTKRNSPKTQRKNKSNAKKPILKEFKYCILTDLKIGEGEFSETFQGYRYDLGPPLKIAAKRLKFSKEKDEKNVQNLLSEISVLSQLGKHHYVIEFLGVYYSDATMYLVFEYADKGDLKRMLDVCRKNGRKDLHLNHLYKLRIAYEIAAGMEYVASLDIVHKDLAARNILLDKDYTCKIADFGCCKAEFFTKMPIRWMAPESLNKLLFTTASDVWSFGVLLWELYTFGLTPYPGMTDDEVIGRINQWYRLYKPQDCPNEIYAIMLSCWKEYHKARPRFFNLKTKFRDLYKMMSESQNPNSASLI